MNGMNMDKMDALEMISTTTNGFGFSVTADVVLNSCTTEVFSTPGGLFNFNPDNNDAQHTMIVGPTSSGLSINPSVPNEKIVIFDIGPANAKTFDEAALLPIGNLNGMKISFTGVLSHGARALREMAQPLHEVPEHVAVQWDDRLQESMPELRAFSLEELSRHLDLLKNAFVVGDAATVRQFFDLYVFD